MIIPIKCFTCGKVLADKWEYYKRECENLEKKKDQKSEIKYFSQIQTKEVLDRLGLDRYCCRRHMLGHVDIIDDL
jgi:DNA-directed RNA polymerase subunit N (RpoN/RPB10)